MNLTPKEKMVLDKLIETGGSNEQIAEALGIAEGTVRTHLRNLFMKYRVINRSELIVRASNDRIGTVSSSYTN